jgi:hypothetical protein
MASPERISEGKHYEVIDSAELARRWVLPVSWVREHVRSRVTDPIPHIRFGRYVRCRWGQPGTGGLDRGAHGQFERVSQTNAVIMQEKDVLSLAPALRGGLASGDPLKFIFLRLTVDSLEGWKRQDPSTGQGRLSKRGASMYHSMQRILATDSQQRKQGRVGAIRMGTCLG